MATVSPTVTKLGGDDSTAKFVYAAMTTTNDTGIAIAFAQWADRSVQVTGTLGVGGTLRVEGSNDGGTTYHVLTDPQGNNLDFTTLKVEQVTEVVELIRPRVTAGDGTTSLNVNVVCRRAQPARNA